MSDLRPIGVFDSGLGGLTVLSEIKRCLPHEDLIYFGDTARVPYGSKSKDTVIQYSKEIVKFLIDKNVKQIVVACNTASASALEVLKNEFDVPMLGVVEPGVEALLKNKDIETSAVIATRSTIKSGAYEKKVVSRNKNIKFYSRACPLFVPLIEEGFLDKKFTREIIHEYLDELLREEVTHVILGCTHYPLLKKIISEIYPQLNLIDSSRETALELKKILKENKSEKLQTTNGKINLYVSDITENLLNLEKVFFGNEIHTLEKVSTSW